MKRQKNSWPMLAGWMLLVSVSFSAQAEIYKCRHGDGRLFYTDTPCKYTAGSVRVPLKRRITGADPGSRPRHTPRVPQVNRALKARPDYGDR